MEGVNEIVVDGVFVITTGGNVTGANEIGDLVIGAGVTGADVDGVPLQQTFPEYP